MPTTAMLPDAIISVDIYFLLLNNCLNNVLIQDFCVASESKNISAADGPKIKHPSQLYSHYFYIAVNIAQ